MQTITRSEAINQNKKWYFTGKPCSKGHIAKRGVKNSTCYKCQQSRSKNFQIQNPDYASNYNTIYYPKNKEKLEKHSQKYYVNITPERLKEIVDSSSLIYRQKPDKKQMISKRGKIWRKIFPGITNAATARRRAALKNAVPKWANHTKIREIYEECSDINTMNRLAGGNKLFVVDHIIPLQGKSVCGLHVENNLQIVLDSFNSQKANKLLKEFT